LEEGRAQLREAEAEKAGHSLQTRGGAGQLMGEEALGGGRAQPMEADGAARGAAHERRGLICLAAAACAAGAAFWAGADLPWGAECVFVREVSVGIIAEAAETHKAKTCAYLRVKRASE